jgi:hypothetical protein
MVFSPSLISREKNPILLQGFIVFGLSTIVPSSSATHSAGFNRLFFWGTTVTCPELAPA